MHCPAVHHIRVGTIEQICRASSMPDNTRKHNEGHEGGVMGSECAQYTANTQFVILWHTASPSSSVVSLPLFNS